MLSFRFIVYVFLSFSVCLKKSKRVRLVMNEERLGNFNLADDRQLKVAYYTFDGVEEPIYTI